MLVEVLMDGAVVKSFTVRVSVSATSNPSSGPVTEKMKSVHLSETLQSQPTGSQQSWSESDDLPVMGGLGAIRPKVGAW